jgi:hypothetical protein
MNADPGVLSTRGSEGRGRGEGGGQGKVYGTHVRNGKTSKVRNYAEISELQ